jgi:hypothetical protein
MYHYEGSANGVFLPACPANQSQQWRRGHHNDLHLREVGEWMKKEITTINIIPLFIKQAHCRIPFLKEPDRLNPQ